MKPFIKFSNGLALLALAGSFPAAHAGTPSAMPPPPPATVEPMPSFLLDLGATFEFGDTTSAGPSGDVFHSRVSVPLFIPLSDSWKIIGILRGGYTDYETAPFDEDGIETFDVGGLIALEGDLGSNWSATLGALGSASWEDGASFSDSLNGGGLVLASYRFSPTLKIGIGGLYMTRTNEDALAIPALGLDWQVTEQFDITLYGLDLRAEYDFSDEWSIYARGEFDPSGSVLKDRKGVEADSFDDQGFRAAGGIKWSPTRSFSLSVEGGVAFHEYTLRNDREEILAKDRIDPAPFAGVSARLSF